MAIAARKRLPAYLVRPHALEALVKSDGTIDWSPWYLTEEEDMGQSGEQCDIIDVLRSSLAMLAEERGWSSLRIASDEFFAWVESETYVQASPEVYLLDDPPITEERLPRRWETWRPGHNPPRFAVEIVSSEWKKDYAINPARYDHMGVAELVLVDADALVRDLSARGRAPLVVYRRSESDRLERVYFGAGPAFCAEIDAYLCFGLAAPGQPRVRISRDPHGEDRVATIEEDRAATKEELADAEARIAFTEKQAAKAEKQAAKAEKQAAKAKKQAAKAEQQAAARAEEIAALRARLQELEGSGGRDD